MSECVLIFFGSWLSTQTPKRTRSINVDEVHQEQQTEVCQHCTQFISFKLKFEFDLLPATLKMVVCRSNSAKLSAMLTLLSDAHSTVEFKTDVLSFKRTFFLSAAGTGLPNQQCGRGANHCHKIGFFINSKQFKEASLHQQRQGFL